MLICFTHVLTSYLQIVSTELNRYCTVCSLMIVLT